jgi:hypothetical protein
MLFVKKRRGVKQHKMQVSHGFTMFNRSQQDVVGGFQYLFDVQT